ncbi:MAG: hypothetical protein AAF773_19480 [Cyanobacteria bacterium P01_D01_bin.115]
MSWVNDLASFAKKLLLLETRVETNTKEIKALRQDLKALTEFTQKVAYAVRRNHEQAGYKHSMLVTKLENELLKLECRLNVSSQSANLNGSSPHRPVLPEGNDSSEEE